MSECEICGQPMGATAYAITFDGDDSGSLLTGELVLMGCDECARAGEDEGLDVVEA